MKIKEELKELKLKTAAELHKLLAQNREKLRDIRFKISQNQVKNIREFRELKKKIAKILTIINQNKTKIKQKESDKTSK